MDHPDISILIPTLNEEDNIIPLYESIKLHLSNHNYEIIFIDDDSSDGTRNIIKKIRKNEDRINLIERKNERGLGSAYRTGLINSKGDKIIMMDADLSHDPKYIPQMIDSLKKYEFVLGSRKIKGGKVVGWPIHRQLISNTANGLASLILNINIKDITSGFRCFNKKTIYSYYMQTKCKGYEFQIELINILSKNNISIFELPIVFKDRTRGASKLTSMQIFNFIKFLINQRMG